MNRELPLTWAPEWPPEPGRLARLFDKVFERCPLWDQFAIAGVFAVYLCAMGAWIYHLA